MSEWNSQNPVVATTFCLTHQLPEDRPSDLGLVCNECKQRLESRPPNGPCISFWETAPNSQWPEPESRPVFTLAWDDFRIRSLHPIREVQPERLLAEAEGLARSITSMLSSNPT